MDKTIYTFTCQNEKCGKEFQATKYWARYCSLPCQMAVYRKRKKEKAIDGQAVNKNKP